MFQLGNWSEAASLSEAACREDPYSCAARVTSALAAVKSTGGSWRQTADQLSAAAHLDPADLVAMHDIGKLYFPCLSYILN